MNARLDNALEFDKRDGCERFGLKGPRAAEWLEARGIALPEAPNQWVAGADTGTGDALLVAPVTRAGATQPRRSETPSPIRCRRCRSVALPRNRPSR